ncbi:unnamed protein product [Prorocentrum cordatum]|uniref:Autophagy-related protein 2 n=1 Tax=Prorocentrum cordatum TaxID=2364126 RepID=A0ABN9XR19_9DINO|nr:unnamed protein product [Polarella glacialis]
MAGLLNRLAGFVVRKALNLEKYLDDVDSLSFRVQSGDGWIPEQMEVAGPLRIKSNLLKQKTEKSPVDVPATVDTDEGGHADRIVVRLPSWARDGLRGYLPARLPWRPTDRAASSSSPAKSVLPPVKPPPPLRLPGSREARFAEAEETPIEEASREQIQDRYDEPEKVIVEVHGLDFRLRTYSAEELAELRQLTCEAVLEALVRAAAGSDLKTDTASSSTARAGAWPPCSGVRRGGVIPRR